MSFDTSATGRHLRIRTMVYLAGEAVPFYWPMRSFIHHNPLHGLEHLAFDQAVEKGGRLFHAQGFLPRSRYQAWLQEGLVDRATLAAGVERFVRQSAARHGELLGINLHHWLSTLITRFEQPLMCRERPFEPQQPAKDICAAGYEIDAIDDTVACASSIETERVRALLHERLAGECPLYEAVDALFNTGIAETLNKQLIRACLDFFDEGQSAWVMPDREQGFFAAWRQVAGRAAQALLLEIERAEGISTETAGAELVIDHLMRRMGVSEQHWTGYFNREIAQLHGWAGFIRWRASARHYYWAERYPADLVDMLAVRQVLAWLLLEKAARQGLPSTVTALQGLIDEAPQMAWLRAELYSGYVHAGMVTTVEQAIEINSRAVLKRVFDDYCRLQRGDAARQTLSTLQALACAAGDPVVLQNQSSEWLEKLLSLLLEFERGEGMLWLRAMEAQATRKLLQGISLNPAPERAKRPFTQAAFCIDTRSERIRRHLEAVGDYESFGIAGFFGVPVSLIELGKGSETPLSPVLLTPRNVVLEVPIELAGDEAAFTTLGHAAHELKETVFSPFVTVEAIGLLFGFDMIGKTLAPQEYHRWRQGLNTEKPATRLLLDKLGRKQADSILRAVQRAVIAEAIHQDLRLPPEAVDDELVRQLRELALGHTDMPPELAPALDTDTRSTAAFIERLRTIWRISPAFEQGQMEQLGRIGFTLDEQVHFVAQALSSIGLVRGFSRFVLLVGHGSTSENNPFESALDCGACGGNHGLVSARVLAQMANKQSVRQRLTKQGIVVPDDTWFVPALHNTTTDEIVLHDLPLLPPSHLVYLDRLRAGLTSASRLCAQERMPELQDCIETHDPAAASRAAQRNAVDWSQVRPEWGLSRNTWFVIGRRALTRSMSLDGRAFLHSWDYRLDPKLRLLENILTGPLVVGQWINMEHYFSTVDNERYGSGSKVYHNVAGRFGVMTGNLGDLRTGLPSQTVLNKGQPWHLPMRLITLIEAPLERAKVAIDKVTAVKRLVRNGWIRLIVLDPETAQVTGFDEESGWQPLSPDFLTSPDQEPDPV